MQGLTSSTSMTGIGGGAPVVGMVKADKLKGAIIALQDVERTDLLPDHAKAILLEPYTPPASLMKAFRRGRSHLIDFVDDGERLTLAIRSLIDPDMDAVTRLDMVVLAKIAVDSIVNPPADALEVVRRAADAASRLSRQGYTIPQSTLRRLRAVRQKRGLDD